MKWLILAIIILCVLVFLPVKLIVTYREKVTLYVSVAFLKFNIDVTGKKNNKVKKTGNKKPKNAKKDGSIFEKLSLLKDIIKILVKRLPRAITVKRLKAHIKVATDDPCTTALTFGAVNAAVYPIVDLLDSYLVVKNRDIDITADYNGDNITADFELVILTRLVKLISFLIMLLKDYYVLKGE